jgi:hypothetical protein
VGEEKDGASEEEKLNHKCNMSWKKREGERERKESRLGRNF